MLLHIRRFVSGICYDAGGGKYWSIHHIHPKLKVPWHGVRFRTRDDIAIAVRRLIMTNFNDGEAYGIRQLPHRWKRTITVLGITLKACEMLMSL